MGSYRGWLASCVCLAGLMEAKADPAAAPKGGLKVTAQVDGYTMATMFNQQKYPFKYSGTAQLDAEQVKALAKPGEVPAATAKAFLGCLLWPKEDDTLEKAVLKSDGKKLIGEVEVLHKYGKQGTHTLKLRLEGTVDGGRLTLKVAESTVSGSWDSGFPVKLQGKVDITIAVEPQ